MRKFINFRSFFVIILVTSIGVCLASQTQQMSRALLIPSVCKNNDHKLWLQGIKQLQVLYTTDKPLFKRKLFKYVSRFSNVGVNQFSFADGKKYVYRSSILSGNSRCLKALIKQEGLKNIIYLYSGNYIDEQTIPFKEEAILKKMGGRTYIRILNFTDEFHSSAAEHQLEQRVSNIINLIADLKGTTLVHCIGGWHRTGIVYGVMQKCIQKLPIKQVIQHYKKHVGYTNKQNQGVYKQINVNFIKNFNCQSLVLD